MKIKWDRATTLKPLTGNLTRVVMVTYPQLQNDYSINCITNQDWLISKCDFIVASLSVDCSFISRSKSRISSRKGLGA